MDFESKIVELKNISMKYHTPQKETLVIDGLNLDVYSREFVTIVGPSGCGKSTLLSIISGLISPAKGEVNIGARGLYSINQQAAYMLQKDYLFDWRNIRQNVLLGLEIKKKATEKNKKHAVKLLQKYGLGKFLNCYPHQLSGGMRQKVALIRTLAVNPKILLLDEPFSAFDYQTKITISEEVRQIIKKEKKAAILVSHDISEAISLSDRVIILSKRPAKIKKVLKIKFECQETDYRQKLKDKKFNGYFDAIWNELNDDE
ncbi:MAG: ABC transporter ATP-binding protein [Oscillospiraceae bacterium]|jgi:NitT/TauT family transport system ATP-binding protein|nr:ABC transporter ATP-binding protein [Oscillospiraceae bacterium]